MKKSNILTKREKQIIEKKLKGEKISRLDSNILTRSIRPKLRAISEINAKSILQKLEYSRKSGTEKQIKKLILENLKDTEAIVLYGSAIQTNYQSYNDLDILVITKKKTWNKTWEKHEKINKLLKLAEKLNLNLDLQIIDKASFYKQYAHNPSLIYQLKDSKVIYGKLNLRNKIELYNIDLKTKLDWSDLIENNPNGLEIYKALRNVILIRLLLKKIIDNETLNKSLNEEIGKNLIERLKTNKESRQDRKIAKYYLKNLIEDTYKQLKGDLWEKRVVLKV
ncbi:MAG: nucleotidyltransferase domain-containing protein [Nanoarchaeota archaeon]